MAERQSGQQGMNWPVVLFGGLVLVLLVAIIPDQFFRALAALFIFVATYFMAQSRDTAEVENPLLEQARTARPGLDRRKYGHLRAATERLLDEVRNMNRIAVEGREAKLSQHHAHAELDRLAGTMRDLVDEIRKSAGIPTPTQEKPESEQPVRPHVVIPKAKSDDAETTEAPFRVGSTGAPDATDVELDQLVAKAETEARARAAGVDADEGDVEPRVDEERRESGPEERSGG